MKVDLNEIKNRFNNPNLEIMIDSHFGIRFSIYFPEYDAKFTRLYSFDDLEFFSDKFKTFTDIYDDFMEQAENEKKKYEPFKEEIKYERYDD